VSAALDTYEQTFDEWDKLAQRNPEDVADDGVAFRVYEQAYLKKILSEAREVVFEGYNVLAINSTLMVSEIGSTLAKGKPFAIVWRQKSDKGYVYSLRSDDNGIDVSVIARRYGGNGHPHAAGFSSTALLF
jgi:nanoRNase/pAp phosphatase (c-di-AMP/oligoRNAs hydrolase)